MNTENDFRAQTQSSLTKWNGWRFYLSNNFNFRLDSNDSNMFRWRVPDTIRVSPLASVKKDTRELEAHSNSTIAVE